MLVASKLLNFPPCTGACLNAALLYRALRREGIFLPQPGWLVFALKVGAAVGFMALALHFAMGKPAWWLAASGQLKLPAIIGLVLLGTGVYAAALAAFGFRPRHFSRKGAG